MPQQPKIKGTGVQRLNMQMPADDKRRLIRLKKRLGAASIAEVIRRAAQEMEARLDREPKP